jgi:hypothetical protein
LHYGGGEQRKKSEARGAEPDRRPTERQILASAGGSFVPGLIARAKIIVSVADMGVGGRAGETDNHAVMEDAPFAGGLLG